MGNPTAEDGNVSSDPSSNNGIQCLRVYPQTHLLGLPRENRDRMWTLIFFDTMKSSEDHVEWNARRKTAWDQVPLTCRQIHEETRDYWPRAVVRVQQVATKFVVSGLTIPLLKRFHHLTLELPRQYGTFQYDEQAAAMLDFLSPFLRDLRIYFVGEQGQGRRKERTCKTCLLHIQRDRPQAVAAELDAGEESQQQIVNGKGEITSNEITKKSAGPTSPKAIVDAIQKMTRLVTLVIDEIDLLLLSSALVYRKPDLDRLHVTASPDAVLHRHPYGTYAPDVGVPQKRSGYFKKLCLSANAVLDASRLALAAAPTLRDFTWTVPLMDCRHEVRCEWIQQTSEILRCLSIKATNLTRLRICIEQEISEDRLYDSTLVGAIRDYLPALRNLQSFEFHLQTDSRFLPAETIQSLPPSLKRFYTTESFIPPDTLVREIESRYLDYTWPCSGALGFIGYEFTTPEAWTAALKLNGRLLDRERNLNMSQDTRTANKKNISSNSTTSSHNSRIASSILTRPTILRPDDETPPPFVQQMPLHTLQPLPWLNENDDFPFDGRYDTENEALEKLWRAEKCATWDDLKDVNRKWLEQRMVRAGEHWIEED